jgi:hypothetical protein
MLMFLSTNNRITKNRVKDVLRRFILDYHNIVVSEITALEKPKRKVWKFDDCDEEESKRFLRFKKRDLRRLFDLLDFPIVCKLENRSRMSGEELFIRGLYEIATGEAVESIASKFGRHYTDQTRAFTFFIHHIYYHFNHLITNNLDWWFRKGYIEKSAKLIENKMGINRTNVYALFIDCNCLETSRPGGGPTEQGANARRWNPDIQRSFYNGWKSVHGLKHQTLDCAFGMTVDIFGPRSLRRNDLKLYQLSNVNDRVYQGCVQWNTEYPYSIFGDSAYKLDTACRSYLPGDNQLERDWNKAMKKVRISIEWNYMTTASLFKYLRQHDKLRLLQSHTVTKVYTVATLLKNFHTCLYGNQTSNYFDFIFSPNFLEEYIRQQ